VQGLSAMAMLAKASAAVSDIALHKTFVRIRYPKPELVRLNVEGLQ
jgi:hypothetical protein